MDLNESRYTDVNGRINTKKLLRIISTVKQSERIKSAATPIEQTTKQYRPVKIIDQSLEGLKNSGIQVKAYSIDVWYVFEILMASGCRISEVLSIRAVDLMSNGMIRIKGKKGSNDRIVTAGGATDYILKCKRNGVKPFQFINRKFVWTVFKRYGISLSVSSSKRKVVTHAIRHLIVASAKESGIENETTGSFIGHKNKENTKRYGGIKKS